MAERTLCPGLKYLCHTLEFNLHFVALTFLGLLMPKLWQGSTISC